ncbi:phosphatase PAP2 family protein [Nocardiopsis sp. CNT312]|uniref:phosphatase PAP2 family protein n=1 Tax=Nocardiopsis sp. CNT312 TaxID=1137268 RepID=UPI001E659F38|nr:phosphatase PAP2 family protein [Nocardiopsis sp. CNT312]
MLAPGVLVVVVLLAIGWYSDQTPAGILWGLLAALFCGIVPYAILILGARIGWWTDRHVRERRQRFVPLLIVIGCVTLGIATLVLLDAPRELFALVVAMLTALAITLAITVKWKVSVHTAVAGGVSTVLVLTYGAVMAATVPLIALVGWSRVRLGDHTPAQTVVGAVFGAAVAATVFSLLR